MEHQLLIYAEWPLERTRNGSNTDFVRQL